MADQPAQPKHIAVLQLLQDQFLPLALVTAMITGYYFPGPGVRAAQYGLQNFTTTGIFIISGVGLRRGEAEQALSDWGSALYGFVAILVLTPLAALAAVRLPLSPPELPLGLAVFCCMPTTLSSGVSLTQAVGGNTAMALLLTVGTNLAGIFTLPFALAWLVGPTLAASSHLAPGPLLRALVQTILVPLLTGTAARAFIPGVARAVDANKKRLALLSAVLLALVPWMQISRTVTSGVHVSVAAMATTVAAGVGIHLAYLAFNLAAVSTLGLGGADAVAAVGMRRALVLVASQKTLPIAVAVLGQLARSGGGVAAGGLAVLPCVAAHLTQILIDSLLVSHWLRRDALTGPDAA